MRLQRALTDSRERGFTLIEILVVTTLMALIVAAGLVMGVDAISRSAVASERDVLVATLATARTRALANVNESAHGVYIDTDSFIAFEGDSYALSDPTTRSPLPRNDAVEVSGINQIVFEQITGNVLMGVGAITLSGSADTDTIEINSIGRIEW